MQPTLNYDGYIIDHKHIADRSIYNPQVFYIAFRCFIAALSKVLVANPFAFGV